MGTIRGTDEIFARIVGVDDAALNVQLEPKGASDFCRAASREVAERLAQHLGETVKLTADVVWNRETLRPLTCTITGIDEGWQNVHLADVVEAHGGRLPITADYESVEDLIRSRR